MVHCISADTGIFPPICAELQWSIVFPQRIVANLNRPWTLIFVIHWLALSHHNEKVGPLGPKSEINTEEKVTNKRRRNINLLFVENKNNFT